MEFECPDDYDDDVGGSDSGHFVWFNALLREMNCHKPLNGFGIPHEHFNGPLSKWQVNKYQWQWKWNDLNQKITNNKWRKKLNVQTWKRNQHNTKHNTTQLNKCSILYSVILFCFENLCYARKK